MSCNTVNYFVAHIVLGLPIGSSLSELGFSIILLTPILLPYNQPFLQGNLIPFVGEKGIRNQGFGAGYVAIQVSLPLGSLSRQSRQLGNIGIYI